MNVQIRNYQKALEIYMSVGMEYDAKSMTDLIDRAKARCKGDAAGDLIGNQKIYIDSIQRSGENSVQSTMTGVSCVFSLRHANCSIEAERLVTKLAAISRQVYGDEHQCYKRCSELLNQCKMRFIHTISIDSGGNFVGVPVYRALRCENDGQKCFVAGPISGQRPYDENEEVQTFRIASSLFSPAIGCPVICHGLINASHLNSKMSESGPMRLGSILKIGV